LCEATTPRQLGGIREEDKMDALWRLRGTTVSLVGIWLAVPLVGVFGGDIVTETGGNDGTRSKVPAVVPVAALAVAATFFVTWFAYRSEKARATAAADLSAERPIHELGSTPAPQDGPVTVGHR
jgi:hypothetical protein